LGQPTPAFGPLWQHGPASPDLKAQLASVSRPMAEGGEALPWRVGGGPIPASQRWRTMAEQWLEHVGDMETLLVWLEKDGTRRGWLSAAAVHRRRRVTGGRPEMESRPALKWTPRYMALGRSL
jgi:hypothetical protein